MLLVLLASGMALFVTRVAYAEDLQECLNGCLALVVDDGCNEDCIYENTESCECTGDCLDYYNVPHSPPPEGCEGWASGQCCWE